MINYTFLFIGLMYTTILPGFVVTELLLQRLAFWKKLPLYLILSVIVSSYFSYFAGLIFGFNRWTLFGCFLIFLSLFVYILVRRKINIELGIRKNWWIIFTGILIYAAYFIALSPAIFRLHNDYFVMGGPNWQDTAMHLSIIESLAQGNFPPQAPYFSGQPLSYYYFSDLHAAIVNTFFGNFFPEILVLLNPFLAMTYFFSVYALSFEISKKKTLSLIAGVGAVLFGNFEFIYKFKTFFLDNFGNFNVITKFFNPSQNYFFMTTLADYFLQNRPMMVGLSVFTLIVLMLTENKEEDKSHWLKIFITGVITASLIKFQLFGFMVSWMFFGIYTGLKLLFRKISFLKVLKQFVLFGAPSLILALIFSSTKIEGRSIVQVAVESTTWLPWKSHSAPWFIIFILGDFGLGILVYFWAFFIRKVWKDVDIFSVYLVSLLMFIIPFLIKFTIYDGDMLKFFYYFTSLMCALLAYFYSKSVHFRLGVIVFLLITLISSISSINLLALSYSNKNEGYSLSDYEVGTWIRENTPEKSVFVTIPTVHSAPTDIGGRLRIISYINWPYSHGFNVGEDNVFSRATDVEAVYKTGDISQVKLKYGAGYVFYGGDEKGEFPDAGKLFDESTSLKRVYDKDGIEIYAIL